MDPFTTDPFGGDHPFPQQTTNPFQSESDKNLFSGADPFAFDPFSDPFGAQTGGSHDSRPSFESLDPFKTFAAPLAATSKHFEPAYKDGAADDFHTFLAFEVSPPSVASNEETHQSFGFKSADAFEGLDPFSVVQVKTASLKEHQVNSEVISAKPAITFEDDPFCTVAQSKTTSKEVFVSEEFSNIKSAQAFEEFTRFTDLEKSLGATSNEPGIRREIGKVNSTAVFEELSPFSAFGNPFSGHQSVTDFKGNDPFLAPGFQVPDSKETFRRSNAFEDSDPFEDLTKDTIGEGSEITFKVSCVPSPSPTHEYLTQTSYAKPVLDFEELSLPQGQPQTPSSNASFVSACEEFTSEERTTSKESFLARTDGHSNQPAASETLHESTKRSHIYEEFKRTAAFELQTAAETSVGDWPRLREDDRFSNISSDFPIAESRIFQQNTRSQISESNPWMKHKNGVSESSDHVDDYKLDNTSTSSSKAEKVSSVSLSFSEQTSSAEVAQAEVTSEIVVEAIPSGALRSQAYDDDQVDKSVSEAPPAIPPIPAGGLPPISSTYPGISLSEEEEPSSAKSEPSSTLPSFAKTLLQNTISESSTQPETKKQIQNRFNDSGESSRDVENGSEILTVATAQSFSDQRLAKPDRIELAPETSTSNYHQQPQRDLKPYLTEGHTVAKPDLQSTPDVHDLPPLQTETEDETKRESEGIHPVSVREEELPPASFTKTMLAKFKQMEEENAKNRQLVPLKTKSAPSTPIRRPVPPNEESRRKVSPRPTPFSSTSSSSIEGRSLSRDGASDDACVSRRDGALETVDEMPQRGLAKNLLAQWRMLEAQDMSARERAEQRTRPPVTTRSQSLSRIEENQRSYFERASMSKSYAVADSESVSETSSVTLGEEGGPGQRMSVTAEQEASYEDDYLPPPLMTRYVLAKFRDLEAESQIIAGIQPKPRKEEKQEKSFKWEVKEAVPLVRGGLIVHGDLPRGMSTAHHQERKRSVSEPATCTHSITDEEEDVALREDELPPPELTKALLAHFRLIEESRNGTFDAPRGPGNRHRIQIRSEGQPEASEGSEYENWGRGAEDVAVTPTQHQPHPGNQSDEMPEQGTTRSLLAKFQLMQSSR